MKYLFSVLISLTLIATSGVAQKSKIRTAGFDLDAKKYESAKQNIDEGMKDPAMQGDPYAWDKKARVYITIFRERDSYPVLAEGALDGAFEACKKVMALDVKNKYRNNLFEMGRGYLIHVYTGYRFLGDSATLKKEYESAYENYGKAIEANEILRNETKIFPRDTSAAFQKAVVGYRLGKKEESFKVFDELVQSSYKFSWLYQFYGAILTENERYDDALVVLDKGVSLFPDDNNVRIAQLNVYITSGRPEKAVEKFEEAVKLDPENTELIYALSKVHTRLFDSAEAQNNIEKAGLHRMKMFEGLMRITQLDTNHFDAHYDLGATFVNDANELRIEMNNLPLKEKSKYAKLEKASNDLFKQAIPYLERAHAINEEDMATMKALAKLYKFTGDSKKYAEMKLKMQ